MMFYQLGVPSWSAYDAGTGELLGWVYVRDRGTAVGRALSLWYDPGEPSESVRVTSSETR